MSNLFDNYFSEVPRKKQEKLFNVLRSQAETLRNKIMEEEGPIKKENAENAMNSLWSTLESYLTEHEEKSSQKLKLQKNSAKLLGRDTGAVVPQR